MGFVDDFLLLPNWLKYLAFMAVLLGTTLTIPIVGINLGDVFNPFFGVVLGAFGLHISFKEMVIIVFVVFAVMFVLAFQRAQR